MSDVRYTLYRHFAADETLLYVGISFRKLQRLSEHRKLSSWFHDIAKITFESMPDRETALASERTAVQTENPVHNVQLRAKIKENHAAIEEARDEITYRVVNFKPLYKLDEAANMLDIHVGQLKKIIAKGDIQTIELPTPRQKIRITGWNLLDYLESRMTND